MLHATLEIGIPNKTHTAHITYARRLQPGIRLDR